MTTDVRTGVPGSAEALRHVMGRFISGVTILTAMRHDIKYAMTATAVSSVSLDPPLILVCVSKTSRFHSAIMEVDSWATSLLAADQLPIARHFSDRTRDLLTQFDNIDHTFAPISQAPLIEVRSPGWSARPTRATTVATTPSSSASSSEPAVRARSMRHPTRSIDVLSGGPIGRNRPPPREAMP